MHLQLFQRFPKWEKHKLRFKRDAFESNWGKQILFTSLYCSNLYITKNVILYYSYNL